MILYVVLLTTVIIMILQYIPKTFRMRREDAPE